MASKKTNLTIPQIIRKRRTDILIRRSYLSLFSRCIVLALALFLLLTQVFLITQVHGNEMFPALEDGDLVFGYRLQSTYSKNDVVVYTVDGETKIGRILGRGGDILMMDDSGNLQVNGTTQGGDIMYPTYAKEGYEYPFVVPEDSFFLLGDYRTQCEDSRDFGHIQADDVQGKVITILRRRGI